MDLKMEFANGWPITTGTAQYERLMQANYPVPFLLSLLKDPDPKIRTLAASALVAKGDPRLQRHLGPLLVDQNPTFDVITTLPTVQLQAAILHSPNRSHGGLEPSRKAY
jgi:HEAT repeat protein